jgi:hypothetical protein
MAHRRRAARQPGAPLRLLTRRAARRFKSTILRAPAAPLAKPCYALEGGHAIVPAPTLLPRTVVVPRYQDGGDSAVDI